MNIITRDTLPLLSFIIGLGVAVMLFHKPFTGRRTLAIPLADIEGQTISHGGKCYKYHAEDSQCEILPSK